MKFSKLFFLPILLGIFFTSCTDEDTDQKTIVDLVIENPDFSILEAAVIHAGVADALKSNSITVFAPTNEAFKTIGINSEADITALDKSTVASILTYHVVPSLVPSTAIATKDNDEVTMLDGGKAFITKNATGVSVNGSKVTSADVKAENGAIVHIIDGVMINEQRNIVSIAQAYPELSFLVAAVLRANEGSTKVVDVLSSAGPFTVFAPTNAAFQAAGFPTIASIQQANPDVLANILTYHVISARVYSTNLTTGNVPTAQGGNVAINASTGTVKGNGNMTPSNIVNVNIPASNGVVHLINAVLLP
ncbi:MAG: fasciclin domain-containing protein [Saprospiraceae bacterium]